MVYDIYGKVVKAVGNGDSVQGAVAQENEAQKDTGKEGVKEEPRPTVNMADCKSYCRKKNGRRVA